MPDIKVDILPPSYWQDFEDLTLDLAKKLWNDQYASKNGRAGQKQAGVDIYGTNKNNKERTGIQCKKKKLKNKKAGSTPSSSLTTKEIDEEIVKAKTFEPKLDRFIIATTGPADQRLQEHVRLHNEAGDDLQVTLMFWDNYVDELNSDKKLMLKYFEEHVIYREKHTPEYHYLKLIKIAFDRPAIHTTLYSENNIEDLMQALKDVGQAINTGLLKNRDGDVIEHTKVPQTIPPELLTAKRLLDRARAVLTKGLSQDKIKQGKDFIYISDPIITETLNDLRAEAVQLARSVVAPLGFDIPEVV